MYKKIELALLLLLLAGLAAVSRNLEKYVSSDHVQLNTNLVVIDAGHGDADPGKVGVNNALEKDINLKIAEIVEEKLTEKGYEVVMTRDKDEMLADPGSTNKKIQDMKARVELINEKAPALALSIHQNSYHDGSIHGAQVFYYSHSDEGENAAKILQGALLEVDPENTRQAKANDSYYLLKRTEVPTIIVECGFLSNAEEAEKLVDEEYQQRLADAITQGIIEYLESKTIGK